MALKGQSYGWTQTPLEVNITLKLPSGVKARDLDVKLGTEECKVRLKAGAANEFLMEGKFVKPHRMDESNWWVDDGVLNVQLTKLKRSEWWMSVFEGHKEITWDQLQPEHPTYVEDLDGDTQAMVKKMMFDNQQRQRGLPTRYAFSLISPLVCRILGDIPFEIGKIR